VYDWNISGKEDFIGEFRASFAEVAAATTFDLVNAKKTGKRGYKNSGTFMVLKALAVKVKKKEKNLFFLMFFEFSFVCQAYSFVEYIQGGTQINLMVAIDFTASNGNPKVSCFVR
jgi:hypothetical protein